MADTVLDRLVTILGFRHDRTSKEALDRIQRIRKGMDSLSRPFLIGGVVGAAAIAGVTRLFGNFEQKMAQIHGLVGVSREELQGMERDLRAIGKETGKAPLDLADALFVSTSAGFRGAEAISIVDAAARASAAGLGDMASLLNTLTGALNVYSQEGLTAKRVTDTIVATVREGNLDPESLSGPFAEVLPFARELGIEVEEVGGFFAYTTRQGYKTTRAATALRGVLSKLIKPTEAGKKELAAVGLTMDDVTQTVEKDGLVAGLRLLGDAFGDNKEAMGRFFEDIEGLAGALLVLGGDQEEVSRLFAAVENSTGRADEAYGAVANTLNHKTNRSIAAFKWELLKAGQALAPIVAMVLSWANALAGLLGYLGPAAPIVAGLVAVMLGLGVALKATSIALGGYIAVVKIGTAATLLFGKTSLGIRAYLLAQALATKAAAAAQWLLNASFYGFPLWLIVAALAVAAYYVYRYRKEILAFLESIGAVKALEGLRQDIESVTDALKALVGWAKQAEEWLNNLKGNEGPLATLFGAADEKKAEVSLLRKLGRLTGFFPGSDAKRGPLSHLTESGRAIGQTLAAGMRSQDLEGGLARMLGGLATPLPTGPLPAAAGAGAGGLQLSVTIGEIRVIAEGGDAPAIAEAVGAEVVGAIGRHARALEEEFDSRFRA